MKDEIREKIDEEIDTELNAISYLPMGSDEKDRAIDQMAKLYKLRMEDEKALFDAKEAEEKRFAEYGQKGIENLRKEKELKEQKKDRIVKIVIAGCELVVPLIFYAFWMKKGFKFEEKGIYTSSTFKGLIKHFKPKK